MRRFDRQPEPAWWGAYELRWLYETTGPTVDPLGWRRNKRTLAEHFHAEVRRAGEPPRCAYCDGPLGVTSRKTVDHLVPEARCRALAMTWTNLYPACDQCNSGFKKTRGSCALVLPDVEPVDKWFDFHEETGRLAPAPELDRRTRARVRLTIQVLGLNATERCTERKRFVRALHLAWNTGDTDYVREALTQGPYRFIAEKFQASLQTSRRRLAPLV